MAQVQVAILTENGDVLDMFWIAQDDDEGVSRQSIANQIAEVLEKEFELHTEPPEKAK